jgi:alkylation response protein AidB-like acyl-CoA dehydrogenase
LDFELSLEQEALRDSTRRLLGDLAPVDLYVRSRLDDPRGTTDEVWHALADMGATGLLVPEPYGGGGGGMLDIGVVLEEMGRVVHPGPFLSSAVGAATAVVEVGEPEDAARLLPGIAAGTTVATLALVDGGPGTESKETRAGWELCGTKVRVHDAMAADLLLVTAPTQDGTRLFEVERSQPGVSVEELASVDRTRKLGTVRLEAARARAIGRAGDGADAGISAVVDRMVSGIVADGLGAAGAALEMAVSYAKQRIQFGRPIGAFQAVQHMCAEMLQMLELGRAGAYYALWADGAGPAERHRGATMAKAYASDAFFRIGACLIQVLGGIGFTWEHDAHLYYKRLLSMHDLWGTPEEHLEELARMVV